MAGNIAEGAWHIGLATSTDGINGQSIPEIQSYRGKLGFALQCFTSMVKKDGIYYMFYTGSPENYNGDIYNIGLATSTDGIVWQKYAGNPLMSQTEPWEGSGVAFPFRYP